MNKKVSIILIVLLIIIVTSIVIINLKQLKPNVSVNNATEDTNIVKNEKNNEITAEERKNVEEYMNTIFNKISKIEEFNNINDADKKWIYSHLLTNGKNYERNLGCITITEQQIKEDLSQIFGPNLNIDVKEDTKFADGYYIPMYNKENNKYEFLPTGGEISVEYAIDSIEKEGDKYIVNVVEYSIQRDLKAENPDIEYAIFTYEKNFNENWKNWKKVFSKESDSEDIIKDKVLQQKENFNEYKCILEKDNKNNFYINSFTK